MGVQTTCPTKTYLEMHRIINGSLTRVETTEAANERKN